VRFSWPNGSTGVRENRRHPSLGSAVLSPPWGSLIFHLVTHGLRGGLYSYAASRLHFRSIYFTAIRGKVVLADSLNTLSYAS